MRLIIYLLLHKDEAGQETDDGTLPLHLILRRSLPLRVVSALLDAYPEAMYCDETMLGYLPLHVACRSGCDVDVVQLLIESNPGALKHRTTRNFICCIHAYVLLCL